MPVMRKAPEKLFSKIIVSKGYGFNTPQDGSVCKIKVVLDEANLLSGLDEDQNKEIIVGDVDESVERIIEDCIRTMKEEEECCIEFPHPDTLPNLDIIPVDSSDDGKNINFDISANDTESTKSTEACVSSTESAEETPMNDTASEQQSSSDGDVEKRELEVQENNEPSHVETLTTPTSDPEDMNVDACNNSSIDLVKIQIQLLTYTREPEIWEMSITEKWRRASYHKQRGLELYARGVYQYAFRRFGLTLKYVISLEHDVPSGQEEGMDIKGLKLSCYLNVAACQMRHHNFESVVINSSKALNLQPNNAKALYRRGAAYLQLQEYEKAKEDLTAAQQLEPKNQAIAKQLQVLKNRVQKLNQYYASAMKKMFS